MTFRTGFVSNSSSSSFVCIGYLVDKKKYVIEDLVRKLFPEEAPNKYDDLYDILNGLVDNDKEISIADGGDETGVPEDKVMIGVQYLIDLEDVEEMSEPMEDIIARLKKFSNNIDKNIDLGKIQLITGGCMT